MAAYLEQARQRRVLSGPGSSFRDCAECPEMVVVPAGSFTMGSPAGEAGRDADEGPQRVVTIARAFAVGKFEVTFDQWDACTAGGGCDRYRPGDVGWGRGSRPVINVSWTDAKAYVEWLGRKAGKSYRLLSEAEWEYAARAGTTTAWSCGSSESCLAAAGWHYGNSGGRTQAVGTKSANAFGLHDMHGNVWEWVEDCWHDSYAGAPSDGSAWTTGGDCGRRVL
ncbi:MAG: formylglycine-generating enzyme family protein, partial [Alphaproteobacteria bacterium]|nr:formylglycine-generating enzyme family protein [Alphaproteobacteria bacterium]